MLRVSDPWSPSAELWIVAAAGGLIPRLTHMCIATQRVPVPCICPAHLPYPESRQAMGPVNIVFGWVSSFLGLGILGGAVQAGFH